MFLPANHPDACKALQPIQNALGDDPIVVTGSGVSSASRYGYACDFRRRERLMRSVTEAVHAP